MGAAAWLAIGKFIGAALGFVSAGTGWYAFGVYAARIAILAIAAKAFQPKLDLTRTAREKLLTNKDPIAPQNIIYGEDMLSGPLLFGNTVGVNSVDLWLGVVFAGHEVDSAQLYRFDNVPIGLAALSGAEDGDIISGTYTDAGAVYLRHGSSTQTHVTEAATAFPSEITSAHRGRGWAYMLWKFSLLEDSDVWEVGAPQNLRIKVRGRKLYDPRLDSTNGGSGLHRIADPTTWEWSANAALCLADWMMDTKFGMQEDPDRIDWPLVITAAGICEQTVAVPVASTQDRYTCNATFQSTEKRGAVRDAILVSMMGRQVFSQGKWKMWAGAAITPDVTLSEANLAGEIQLQATTSAKERYNRVRGKFIDPSRDYSASTYPEQRSSAYETLDGGEVRPLIADFTGTNNVYEAQRKAIITLKQSRQQRIISFQGNLSCFRIQPGTTVLLDVAEYGFSGEKFFVTEWAMNDRGVLLTMLEEIDSSWADPAEGDYAVRTATGTIIFANQGVPVPTSPSVTSAIGGVLVSWTNPPQYLFNAVEVWAANDNARGNAVLVATINGGSEYFDQISDDRTRFYWLRCINEFGTVGLYEPNLTTTTLAAAPILATTMPVVPAFAPGFIGGMIDFIYTLNATSGGTPNDGEIRVIGTTFEHPNGSTINLAGADFSINTFYEGTATGRFYLMYSAVAGETRFGGVAADWGSGSPDDTRFVCVTHDSVNGWRARNNGGTYYAFTPLATDCIIAVCDKILSSGGIQTLIPLTGGIAGSDGTPGDDGIDGDPGADGGDGLSVYYASVYKRSASAPSTPAVDDGQYNFTTEVLTPPSTWSVTPQSGADPQYVSQGVFSVVGTTGIDTDVTWGAPTILVKSGGFRDVKFRRSTTQPATPTGNNPASWYDSVPTGTDTVWSITGTKNAALDLQGVWSTPERVSSLSFRGAYAAGTAYILHDVVSYAERSYICVQSGTGNAPSGTNSGNAYWDILAGKGDTGDPPTAFDETIAITGTGPVNLRTLADNFTPAYDGIADATVVFTIASGITLTGAAGGAGGHAIDTGTWPSGATIILTIENEGTVRGGGGGGGQGGGYSINGHNGNAGGDAIYCQEDITIDNAPSGSGTINRGSGGGGGGGAYDFGLPTEITVAGGGGGGGYPNGAGGALGDADVTTGGTAGAAGTGSGGGAGGSGATSAGQNGGDGGNGGNSSTAAQNGDASTGSGGSLGAVGYAVRKNGHTVTATGGTIVGTVA